MPPIRSNLSTMRRNWHWVRYNVPVFLYTVVMGSIAFALSFFDHSGRKQHACARIWSWLILRTLGAHVHVHGGEKVDFAKPQIYACNHQSLLDIPVAYTNLPVQFRIMAKEELFRSPLIGPWLTRSGQIPINRESAEHSLRSLNAGVKSLKSGTPLFVFPEGGRSRDGHIQPFLAGTFYVAIRAKATIVPMAMIGNYEMLPMGSLDVQPQDVELYFADPIDAGQYSLREMDKLAAHVQSVIEDLYYARSAVRPETRPEPTTALQENRG